jgi:hypothetical protein
MAINLARSAPLTGGGTVSGDLTITGDLAVQGGGSLTVDQAVTGVVSITKDSDAEHTALILVNESDAANTTGIISQRFDLEDTAGNAVDSGKILIGKEASFTDTASTQDSYMALHTSLNGTLAEKMRISSSGYVGIGVAPANMLHVEAADGESVNTHVAAFKNLESTAGDSEGVLIQAGTSASDSALEVNNQAGNGLFSVKGDGKVGIGEAAPENTLHVKDDGIAAAIIERTNGSATTGLGDALIIKCSTTGDMADTFGSTIHFSIEDPGAANSPLAFIGAVMAGAENTGDLIFHTYATGTPSENMRITSAGKVGIGIDAPTAKLHIDQASASGAVPVITLDQGDPSEEMMEFLCTIGDGNAIEAAASKTLTTTHFIKVTIQGGLTRYIPVGTIA